MKKNILDHSGNILFNFISITHHLTDSRKIILFISTIILLAFCIILPTTNTSAESFQSNELIQFTFNPTISLNISGNLTIESLTPGDSKDSNIITVTAESNAVAGYTVSSTVGSSTNASTELRKGGTDTTNKFSSITTNTPTLSDFSGNDWGYSYSTDSGTTWQSGDITGTPASGYNGLPLYTTESPIKLINSNTNGTSSIQFKIGAKSTATQIAGEYTNTINFTALANPNPQPIYMQNATLADCGKDMIDIRDYNIYSTALINAQCWMTQNLRLTGTVSSTYSNFAGDDFNVSQYSLDANDVSFADHCDSDNGFYYACAKDSSSADIGVWYNYNAVTAGTVTGDSNNADATKDICPAGWRLPTYSEFQEITDASSSFSGITGGCYVDGSLSNTSIGFWWSTTTNVSNDYGRYILRWKGSNLKIMSAYRDTGRYVRCIKK